MDEQELLKKLANAEIGLAEAKKGFAEAKRALTNAETNLVNAKLHRDRVKEELRVYRAITPKYDPDRRDQEIEQFRQDNPEIMEFIKQRDGVEEEPYTPYGKHGEVIIISKEDAEYLRGEPAPLKITIPIVIEEPTDDQE